MVVIFFFFFLMSAPTNVPGMGGRGKRSGEMLAAAVIEPRGNELLHIRLRGSEIKSTFVLCVFFNRGWQAGPCSIRRWGVGFARF